MTNTYDNYASINLDELQSPVDGKSILVIAEQVHGWLSLEPTLLLLEAYQPDAISLEMTTCPSSLEEVRFAESLLNSPKYSTDFDYETFFVKGSSVSAMQVALVYAIRNGVPLYYTDYQPSDPKQPKDVLSSGMAAIPFSKIMESTIETIDNFFGDNAAQDSFDMMANNDVVTQLHNQYRQIILNNRFTDTISDEEKEAAVQLFLYQVSPYGMALRNEFSAISLNSLGEERIAHIGGYGHAHPEWWHTSLQMGDVQVQHRPLQELVEAEFRYVVPLAAQVDQNHRDFGKQYIPEGGLVRVQDSVPLRLPWNKWGS